jgi:hypothetical protein
VPTTPSDGSGRPAGTALARGLVALLVLATLGALLLAQHLKHESPLVGGAVWHGARAGAAPTFSFQTFYRDHVTVTVRSERSGEVAAVIARDYQAHRYERTPTWRWNGASRAAAGSYDVQAHFVGLDRTVTVPKIEFTIR